MTCKELNTFLHNLKFSHKVSIIYTKIVYKMFCFKQKKCFEMTVGFSSYILLQIHIYCLMTSSYANKESRRTCRSNGKIPLAWFGFLLDQKKNLHTRSWLGTVCTCIKPLKAKLDRKERKRFWNLLDYDCRCGDSYGGRVCPDVTVLQHDPGLVLLLLLRFLHQQPTVGLVWQLMEHQG